MKKAAETGASLETVLDKEFTTVLESTYLTEIFDAVSDANIPIAVVDEKNRMKGIVVRGALIGALSGNDEYINMSSNELEEIKAQEPSAQEVE